MAPVPSGTIRPWIWHVVITLSAGAALAVSVFSLSQGISTVFMHLYYIPLVLTGYYYRRRGIPLIVALSLVYLSLAAFFVWPSATEIGAAGFRAGMFIVIGTIVAILADRLAEKSGAYEGIIANIQDIFYRTDRDGNLIMASPSWAELLGYGSVDECLGKNIAADFYLNPKDREAFLQEIHANGRVTDYPVTLRKKDGSAVIISTSSHLYYDDAGREAGVEGIFRDVTVQQRLERELVESEKRYREFFATSRDCVFITSPDGRWIDFNDSALEIFGYPSREELMAVPISSLYEHPEDRETVVGRIRKDGYVQEYPVHLRRRDGTVINALITTVAIRNADGSLRQFTGTIRDVTESTRLTAALAGSEEKFRIIADYTYDWEYWISPDGRFVYMTPSVERITGYSAGEFYRKPSLFDEIIHPGDRAAYREHMDISRVSDTPESVEYRIVRRDGGIRWIAHICQPMYGSDGALIGRRSSNRDITDRRRAEEALKENEARLMEERDRLALILKTAQDGFWLVNASTGRIEMVNEAACSMLGYSREEMLKRSIADIDAQWSPDELPREIEKTRMAGSARFETRQRARDGRIIDVEISVNYLPATGQFFVFIHNITERKRAENEVHQSFERFRTVMDSIEALVYVADMETYELLFLNRYGRDIWGDIEGKTCWRTIQSGQDGACPFCTNDRLVDAEGRPTGTYVWEFRNTITGRWYDCRDSAIEWIDGRIVRLEIATDITDRKQVEEVLRESEERVRTNQRRLANAMDLAQLVNWEFDVRTGIFSFDERFYALYGTTPEREGGTLMPADVYVREFVHPDDVERVTRIITEALKITDPSHSVQLEHRIIRRDGQVRHIVVRFSPVMDEGGALVRTFGANQDITERKMAEEALQQSEEKFRNIFNSIGDAVYIHSMDGRGMPKKIVAVNDVGCSMVGYSRDELLTMSPLDLITGQPSRPFEEMLDDMAARGETIFEAEHSRKNKTVIPVEINSHTSTLAGEKVVVSVVRDLTERKKAEAALRESERKFHEIFNNANDAIEIIGILDSGAPGGFLDLNDVACRMLGYTKEELLQKGPLDISTPTYNRPLDTILGELKDTGHATFETEHIKKDGTVVPVEINAHTITLLGKPVLLAITRDITERRRAEEALQESERLLADIINFLPDPTFVIDRDHRVIAWNHAIAAFTGIPRETMLKKGDYEYADALFGERRPLLIDLVIRPDPEVMRKHYPHVRQDGRMLSGQFRVPSLKGKPADIWIVSTPLFNNVGEVTGAIESIRDITDIKNTERELADLNRTLEQRVRERTQELEEAQNHTRSLIEADLDPLVLISPDGIIMDVNSAAEKMTGLVRGELKGTPFTRYLKEKEQARAGFEAVVRDGAFTGKRFFILHRDGSATPVIVSAALVRGRAGAPAGVFASLHDITRILEDEEKISAQLKEKEVLLREVHHRVKNNLQVIVSLISLQSRALRDPAVIEALRDTQSRVRAISIVHERLHLSGEVGTIDFGAYLRYLGASLYSFYQKDPAVIRLEIVMEGVILDIDTASPLGLIFNELISNMLKYAFPDGRSGECRITAQKDGGSLILAIHDNGVGMPADLDWKNNPTLGLRLVNILTKQLNGTIELDRTGGTTFTITVPVTKQATGIHHVDGL